MPVVSAPTLAGVRAQFPALRSGFAYMDNAGGSQVPETVANAVREYMLTSYVQLGATYPAAVRATQVVDEAHDLVNTMFGGIGIGKAILGSSTSTLCRMLSDCYAEILGPDDEVIVAESGHAANLNPWVVLAKRGFRVKVWKADPVTGQCDLDGLLGLLSPRTKIVAFPHVSNILGALEPVQAVVDMAKKVGARVVLDSVAFAPHQVLDVKAWGVDFCMFSCYKVFGPHMGALWGSDEALAELNGRNHPFIDKNDIPTKFELGGVTHESCAGMLALKQYFAYLAGTPEKDFSRGVLIDAFEVARGFEALLTERFVEFLNSKEKVRVIGPATSGPERVATVSFLHDDLSPAEIVAEVDKHDIGMRHGNFYSWNLMERLGIPPTRGVARVSFAHYNSLDEVERLIAVLDTVL